MAIANEKELLSTITTAFPPVRKTLVIAPHPDDEVFGCGGTLSLLRGNGCIVTTIIVTNGSLGGENIDGKLIEVRVAESCAAAKLLGLDVPVFWDLPDRGINYGEVLIARLIEAIVDADADLVFLPSPTEWHPDHQAIAFAGAEAIRRLGGMRQAAFYEVTDPLPCPNLIYDISTTEELKLQAIRCFHSQLQEQPYDSRISGINSFRAFHLGGQVKSAEAFTLVAAADLDKSLPILFDGPLATRRNFGFAATGGDMPLVSVIIRSMNRPTLIAALDSLALQTYSNIEVVLVNAKGSEHQNIDQWRGRFPLRLIGNNQQLKRSRAANVGLEAAKGEYLIFLDDDDWFAPHHIAKLIAEFDHAESIVAVYSAIQCVNEHGDQIRGFTDDFDPIQLCINNYIPIHAVLFRRDIVDKGIRFDESIDVCEDWDFWLQLAEHGEFRFVPAIGATYRLQSEAGSGVWDNPAVTQKAMLYIYRKWMHRWSDETLWSIFEYARYKRLYSDIQQNLADRDAQIADRDAQIADRDVQIAKLLSSTSWRITKPIRMVKDFFSRGLS